VRPKIQADERSEWPAFGRARGTRVRPKIQADERSEWPAFGRARGTRVRPKNTVRSPDNQR